MKIVLHSLSILFPPPPKDCYPQSGLHLCIFDPVRIEIWLDVLTILRSTCLTDWIVIITRSGRKIDSNRNLPKMDGKMNEINRKIKGY